jgi:hypothetical protein
MTISIRQEALFGLAALLFSMPANNVAQEPNQIAAGPALNCADGVSCPVTVAAMRVPGIGLPQVGVISTAGMGFGLQDNADVVKNEPYQAQAVTEVKQTLADGSHITQTTTATVARDSSGRTVRIQKLSAIGPWKSASDSSQTDPPTLTTIFDPVAQTHTDYTSDSKVAHVLSLPNPPAGAPMGTLTSFAMIGPGPGAAGAGPVNFAFQGHADLGKADLSPEAKGEQLGKETIQGIQVTGKRTTTTIQAGTIGNDKDLVITRETWYSSDLKLVIQSTQSDPRFGETTYSLTNIQQSEPDSALFQVPSGYTIQKVPAPTSFQTR